MCFVSRDDNDEALNKIVDYFYSKIKGVKIDDFRQINIGEFQHLSDIFELKKMDISFKELTTTFHVPKDWILLERTLLLIMGIVTTLDPKLNPVDIVIPYVEKFVLGDDKRLSDLIMSSTKDLLVSYINLPGDLHKLIRKFETGKVTITDPIRKKDSARIYRGLQLLTLSVLVSFSSFMTYTFYKDGEMDLFSKGKQASIVLGIILLFQSIRKK